MSIFSFSRLFLTLNYPIVYAYILLENSMLKNGGGYASHYSIKLLDFYEAFAQLWDRIIG